MLHVTSSRVYITVSNFPNPSRVYIRLCKHGKPFLMLNCDISIIHVATPIKAYLSVKRHKIYRFSLLSWAPRKSIIAIFTLKLKLLCVVLSVF